MKRKRSFWAWVVSVFVFMLLFSSGVALGYAFEVEETDGYYVEAIAEHNDEVAYSVDVGLVYEMQVVEEFNIETPYDFVEVVSEQDVDDCDTKEEDDYQAEEYEEGPVDMHEYFFLILRTTFPERYMPANQAPVFVVYENGVEYARKSMVWYRGETGTASVEFAFFYGGLMSEHVPGWFLDEMGEITWRVELPTGIRALSPVSGGITILPVSTEGWGFYTIILELEKVATPPTETPTETPETPKTPASPQTGDSATALAYLFAAIGSLMFVIHLKKRR